MREQLNGDLGSRRGPIQRVRPGAVTLIVSALALTLSACSASGSASAPGATSVVASASPATRVGGGESVVSVWTLSSLSKPGIGAYLVAEWTMGGDPLAVYIFKKDIPGSGSSACDASCAKTWPPLLLADGAKVRSSGVAGKLAQLTRSDGTLQVTYNGSPLYFYVGDHGARDTNGQSVSASWTAATP
jgi:predicted lipoprotein with Yx(FWY)xxD motif